MLKSELISILESLPGNPRILISGYEGGLKDISEETIEFHPIVALNYNSYDWLGPHEALDIHEVRARLLWDDTIYQFCNAYQLG